VVAISRSNQKTTWELPFLFKRQLDQLVLAHLCPATLYKNWFVLLNRAVPQLQFDFQSIGSEAGIERFTAGLIDFGASDIAMTDKQMAGIKRGVLLLPMTAGSIVLAYNLPDVKDLKLSREVYVDIFWGNITNWSDPKIAQANPGVTLPNRQITVVHRSDGSSYSQ
jgi:phosphate transport system substrate-binding protein